MGIINKFANLYNKEGELIEKAPIRAKIKQASPRSKKYPGNNLAINIFG